jgi:acetyl/propionyl-CoA carboxylase alpha subunit
MGTINSILIANRGEIAARIISTCRNMGIRSIAVFSDADRYAPYLKDADLAVHIGSSEPNMSYLDGAKIINVAKKHGADAIHPGYGFLAENTGFASDVAKAGMSFIGPNPKAIEMMGSKSKAKSLMQNHKVPIVPGYQGDDQSLKTIEKEAKAMGYPVLLKAVAGGGGKGMRIVEKASELKSQLEGAKREALSAFGNDDLIVERYFSSARHVEFQIFGDQHGNALHILERECSIQRRYQKVIEESPSPVLDDKTRKAMGEAAVNAAKALKYDNAGTVEFIYVGKGEFYFLEVNTRLQVEHPVTETITGLDLVKLQIESAEGKPLSIEQKDISACGYAIECRLYAEDPSNDFLPATGKVLQWSLPEIEGLRVDTGVESGSEISIFYDPMIAKIITGGADRKEAIRKMRYALENTVCTGLVTNQGFLIRLMQNEDFINGNYDTGFLTQHPELSQTDTENIHEVLIGVAINEWHQRQEKRHSLKHLPSGWRNNFYEPQKRKYKIEDQEYELSYRECKGDFKIEIAKETYQVSLINVQGKELYLEINGCQQKISLTATEEKCYVHHPACGSFVVELVPRFPAIEKEEVKGGYVTPMPAQVIKLMVSPGDKVKDGDGLVILSSMKMENTIYADQDGEVEEVYISESENIEAGVLLLKLKQEA